MISKILSNLFTSKIHNVIFLALTFLFFILFLQSDYKNISEFSEGDLMHTARSSFAILNGHLFDFYSYNKPIFQRNDYLPLIYFIFGIYNLPIYFIYEGYEKAPFLIFSLWNKTLLVFFYFLSILYFNKILGLIIDNSHQKKYLSLLFITSPLTIFSVFIFGGYDILGLFFILVGYYSFLRKKLYYFCFFFGVAASFKFIALIIFFPLLLMVEKKLMKLFKFTFICLSFILIQFFLYFHDNNFSSQFLTLFFHKVFDNKLNSVSSLEQIFLVIKYSLIASYFFLCLFIYKQRFINSEVIKFSIFISYVSFILIFLSVKWHPQWFIYITPFISLLYLFIKKPKKLFIFESLLYLSFIWYVFNKFRYNVDITMIANGPFKDFLPNLRLYGSDFFHPFFTYPAYILFSIFLIYPVIYFLKDYKIKKIKFNVFENDIYEFIFYRFVFFALTILIPSFISLTFSLIHF